MTTSEPYDDDAHRVLHASFLAGDPLTCPICGTAVDRRSVPPRDDVSYVRRRLWVSCATCHRSTVLDRREPR